MYSSLWGTKPASQKGGSAQDHIRQRCMYMLSTAAVHLDTITKWRFKTYSPDFDWTCNSLLLLFCIAFLHLLHLSRDWSAETWALQASEWLICTCLVWELCRRTDSRTPGCPYQMMPWLVHVQYQYQGIPALFGILLPICSLVWQKTGRKLIPSSGRQDSHDSITNAKTLSQKRLSWRGVVDSRDKLELWGQAGCRYNGRAHRPSGHPKTHAYVWRPCSHNAG